MGRLAWLIALGTGPLVAMLLVAHRRAPLLTALSDAQAAHAAGDRAHERGAISRATAAMTCHQCTPTDRAEVVLANARLQEADHDLDGARATYAAAASELAAGPGTTLDVTEAREAVVRLDAARDRAIEEAAMEAEKAKEVIAVSVPVEVPQSVTNGLLLARAETALSNSDARAALSIIASLDVAELRGSDEEHVRDLIVGARASALLNQPEHVDAMFHEALSIVMAHLPERWADPTALLRTWVEEAGSRPAPDLLAQFGEVEAALDRSSLDHPSDRVARVKLVQGEALASRKREAEAAPLLNDAINALSGPHTLETQQVTRDMVLLGDIEVRAANYTYAAMHYHEAAVRLDAELTPVRERSEAWRKLGTLYKARLNHAGAMEEALHDDERAFAAVNNALEANDPEVIRDRIELGWAKLRLRDDAGARAQVEAIDHATRGLLKGELGGDFNFLKEQVRQGSVGLEDRVHAFLRPHGLPSPQQSGARLHQRHP